MNKHSGLLAGLVSLGVVACATASGFPRTDSFSKFVGAADAAASAGSGVLVTPSVPFVGRDFAVSGGRVAPGSFALYRFAEVPCVTHALAANGIGKVGYSMEGQSNETHGSNARDPSATTPYSAQEIYGSGAGPSKRTLNLDYKVVSGQECVSAMFFSYPAARPR